MDRGVRNTLGDARLTDADLVELLHMYNNFSSNDMALEVNRPLEPLGVPKQAVRTAVEQREKKETASQATMVGASSRMATRGLQVYCDYQR